MDRRTMALGGRGGRDQQAVNRRLTMLERAPAARGVDLRVFATIAEASADTQSPGPGMEVLRIITGVHRPPGVAWRALERRLVRLEGAVTGLAPSYVVRLPSEAMGDDDAVRAAIAEIALHRLDRAGGAAAGPDHATEWVARAEVCVRAVATALARLRELGILNWVRRCVESWRDGRFVLEQQTNAYAVLPDSQWRGYRPPQEPPVPAPGTWGEPTPMPSALAQAAPGRDRAERPWYGILATDPTNRLAAALASLGRAFMARNS